MGIGRLNVWISDPEDPLGTYNGAARVSVFDHKGVLHWECGRFRQRGHDWTPVPNGAYRNVWYRCGFVEFELPPGCYWVIGGFTKPKARGIQVNYATHIGIVQVPCDGTACVKLYAATLRDCPFFAIYGLRAWALADDRAPFTLDDVNALERELEERFLKGVPRSPHDELLAEVLGESLEELVGEQGAAPDDAGS